MEIVPASDSKSNDLRCRLEQAVEQALDLRKTIIGLPDSHFRVIVDVLLLELGRRVAELNH
ncbi:hypothetical protein ACRAWG_12055 [Methylobacterium sp. P31]